MTRSFCQSVRDSYRWQQIRDRHKEKNKFCIDPFGEHERNGEPAEIDDIHHILPIKDFPILAYEEENLAGLCRACHCRIEAMNRMGQNTEQLLRGELCQN